LYFIRYGKILSNIGDNIVCVCVCVRVRARDSYPNKGQAKSTLAKRRSSWFRATIDLSWH